jgi:hypothetical protein
MLSNAKHPSTVKGMAVGRMDLRRDSLQRVTLIFCALPPNPRTTKPLVTFAIPVRGVLCHNRKSKQS